MAKQLLLQADSYERQLPGQEGVPRLEREYEHLRKGDLFEPADDRERDRLLSVGAAVDPAEQQKREQQQLERQLAELQDRKRQLDEQAKQAGRDDSKRREAERKLVEEGRAPDEETPPRSRGSQGRRGPDA